jgi:hypothetical protein
MRGELVQRIGLGELGEDRHERLARVLLVAEEEQRQPGGYRLAAGGTASRQAAAYRGRDRAGGGETWALPNFGGGCTRPPR